MSETTLPKPSEYKIPSSLEGKVILTGPVVSQYHGERLDLRTTSDARILKLAEAKDCAVVQLKEQKTAEKTTAPAPKPADKEASSTKK